MTESAPSPGRDAARGPGQADEDARPASAGAPSLLRTVLGNAAVLLGLWGLAVVQPLLDVFGRNAAYFVVARMSKPDVVLFALLVALPLPVVLTAVELVVHLVSRRAGRIVHLVFVGLLAVALGATLARHLFGGSDAGTVLVAAAIAGLVTFGVARVPAVVQGVRYLAAALALFVALFLFGSGVSRLLFEQEAEAQAGVLVGARPPIVMVQLDELPVSSLMRADGTINESMFPNFARLGTEGTWYRNATSVAAVTHASVPSIATGNLPESGALPTASEYPRNLFTLLGRTYPTNVHESVASLCPATVCESTDTAGTVERLRGSLADASVVLGHLALPPSLRDGLPAVDHSWGDFLDGAAATEASTPLADDGEGSGAAAETSVPSAVATPSASPVVPAPEEEARMFQRWIGDIGATPSLSYIHTLLPHDPWLMTQDGRPYATAARLEGLADDGVWYDHRDEIAHGLRVHLYQTQYLDSLLGDLVERLETLGIWDDALVVVVADHGAAFAGGQHYRTPTQATIHEIYNVPLFVKYPGQREGGIDDRDALTIDVLPTIVDVLDVETDWTFEGTSLLGPAPERAKPTYEEVVEAVPADLSGLFAVVGRNHDLLPGLDGEAGAAALDPYADLVGQSIDDLDTSGARSGRWWTYAPVERFGEDSPSIPLVQVGRVLDVVGPPPTAALLVLNGVVAGVATDFECGGTECGFLGAIEPRFLQPSGNQMQLLVPEPGEPRRFHLVTPDPLPDDQLPPE